MSPSPLWEGEPGVEILLRRPGNGRQPLPVEDKVLWLAQWNIDQMSARRRADLGQDLEEALARLQTRVLSSERAGVLEVRRIKGRLFPVSIPVAPVDAAERLIVTLISGSRTRQFSFTPRGGVFAAVVAGWHKQSQRIDVSGVSAVLETLVASVDAHRSGRGGRVSADREVARCANCGDMLLAFNKVPVLEFVARPGECVPAQ